jgi:hypothetical protein
VKASRKAVCVRVPLSESLRAIAPSLKAWPLHSLPAGVRCSGGVAEVNLGITAHGGSIRGCDRRLLQFIFRAPGE